MKGRIKKPLDTKENVKLPIPEAGRIVCGEKSAKGFPVSLDYFKASGVYAPIFHKTFGEKPQRLIIQFIDDREAVSCEQRFTLRTKDGREFARGNGEIFEVYSTKEEKYVEVDQKDFEGDLMAHILSRCQSQFGTSPKGWEVELTLRFILCQMLTIMGYWQFSTKAEASSIPQIIECFDFMKEKRGSVLGVKWDLLIKKHKSNKPSDRSQYPVVSLVPNATDETKNIGIDNTFTNQNLLE